MPRFRLPADVQSCYTSHFRTLLPLGRRGRQDDRSMTTLADIATDLARQEIELPSRALGNSGTRFTVFAQVPARSGWGA